MDDRRVGRLFRAVRLRRNLRQIDVALLAGVSQSVVSDIELGRLDLVGLPLLRRVGAVLDIRISIDAWWRGGEADRLLDRAHAELVEGVVGLLRESGWMVQPEFTFNHYGDRGSVDVLAWHPTEQILLIVEVKSTLTDLQDTLATLHKKVRVVPKIVRGQLDWQVRHVATMLVVAGTKANRSIVGRHAATFDAAFPGRSADARRWLRRPSGPISAVWFISTKATSLAASTSRARVRRVERG